MNNDDPASLLTRREAFAALALQGILANPQRDTTAKYMDCAYDARRFADALIDELDGNT